MAGKKEEGRSNLSGQKAQWLLKLDIGGKKNENEFLHILVGITTKSPNQVGANVTVSHAGGITNSRTGREVGERGKTSLGKENQEATWRVLELTEVDGVLSV